MTSKPRVQTYGNAYSFLKNSSLFLNRNESMNNLFWEITKRWKMGSTINWAGNIFSNHSIALSAILTPGDYLLLSEGKVNCVEKVFQYGKSMLWNLNGVTGPSVHAEKFANLWKNRSEGNKINVRKDFIIFSSTNTMFSAVDNLGLSLQKATNFEWPRIRLWASQFAYESTPQLDVNASILMAKSMLNQKNLFLLRKGDKTVGMGGFGRSTLKKSVINMIYISDEYRSKGYGATLAANLIQQARKNGFSGCIMFSDYLETDNLYKNLGCKEVGRFSEIKFND